MFNEIFKQNYPQMKQFSNFIKKKKSDISKKVQPKARKQLEILSIYLASFSRQQEKVCNPLYDQGYGAAVSQVGAFWFFFAVIHLILGGHREKKMKSADLASRRAKGCGWQTITYYHFKQVKC